jgi:hypothetical protein
MRCQEKQGKKQYFLQFYMFWLTDINKCQDNINSAIPGNILCYRVAPWRGMLHYVGKPVNG